ncbi:hypothetical protein GCM10027277_43690 [Pseudoduganella ginsengisoli]
MFEAWDSTLQRRVALKYLKAGIGASANHLLQEARAAASLRHPAFVQVYMVAGGGEGMAIVMELVDGEPLNRLLPLPAAMALDAAQQIAGAMQEAHDAHLVHGDLKPSNLMMEASGRIRILDFGLARRLDPLATQDTLSAQPQGTIAYLAPERLLGGAPAPSGDIYALGVILYEMLAGLRPLAGLNGLALAAAQLQATSDQWHYPDQIAPEAVALIRALTAHDPRLRTPSMRDASAAIGALQHAPVAVPPGRERGGQPAGRMSPFAAWLARAPAIAHAAGVSRLLARPRAAAAAVATIALSAALLAGLVWRAPATLLFSPAVSMRDGMAALHEFDRDGSLEQAIRHFNAILAREPRHAGATAGLALAYALRYTSDGRDPVWLQRADASAQQALQLDDQLALAHTALAWVREYQGRMEEARQATEQALRLDPRNLYALFANADRLIRQQRDAQAEQAIALGASLYPADRFFADLQGKLHFQRGDYAAAEQAFRRSIALQPDAVFAYANLSAALLQLNRQDEALQVLQQGLQVRPNSRLYGNLGTVLFARGDYPGATRNFELAVSAGKGSPNQYLNWANLGDALRWMPGREDEARRAYRTAVDLLAPLLAHAPGDLQYQSRMGLYQARLGQAAEARAWTARAVAAGPQRPDVHFRAAIVHELLGDRSAALAALKQAARLGYPAHLIASEPDLMALRRDPLYHNKE